MKKEKKKTPLEDRRVRSFLECYRVNSWKEGHSFVGGFWVSTGCHLYTLGYWILENTLCHDLASHV